MKIKKFPLFLIICACAAFAAAFTACGSGGSSDGASGATACKHVCESWTDTVNTCTEHKREGVCTECGEKVTQNLAPKGHTFGDWEDTINNCKAHTLKRTCSDCGVTVTMSAMPTGHAFGEWEYVTENCGETRQKRSCSECGAEETKNNVAKPHAFGEWQDKVNNCIEHTQTRTCSNCPAEELRDLNPEGHVFEHGKCTVCDADCSVGQTLYLNKYNSVYGYTYFLEKDDNATELYRRIDDAARLFHLDKYAATERLEADGKAYVALPAIDCASLGIEEKTAVAVWKTFRDDNPLYYWMMNTVVFEKVGGTLHILVWEDYTDGEKRLAANELVYNKVEEYSKMLSGGGAYDKAKTFHDAIIKNVDYVFGKDGAPVTDDWAHSIMGVFAEKGAVCESYARTFQILLNYNGVENVFVTGDGVIGFDDSGNANEYERHAWNLVRLDDGKWYWCDVTWDDTGAVGTGVSYAYFLVNDTQIIADGKSFMQTHIADDETKIAEVFLYPLPERSDKEYSPAE